VGKSSLIEAFNYKKISKSAKPTIGAEFSKKKIRLAESGIEVNLQLWDTAGQERFQSLCTSFYRGSDGCILVFDISCAESYENLEKWRQTFIQTTGDDNKQIPIVLVGNKVDCVNTIHRD
jgi:Ras-related protein Rab-7A